MHSKTFNPQNFAQQGLTLTPAAAIHIRKLVAKQPSIVGVRLASNSTFIYVPKGVRCPIKLSTYFRINAKKTKQFKRTILVANKNSYVSYIKSCSAPVRDSYQLHAAVVKVIIHKNAKVKYSTVQNQFPSNNNTSSILNFVTKRALCKSKNSKMS